MAARTKNVQQATVNTAPFYLQVLPAESASSLHHHTVLLCGSVVEHCVSGAKGCGFDSQGTHILIKMYNLDAIVSRFG